MSREKGLEAKRIVQVYDEIFTNTGTGVEVAEDGAS